MIFARWNSIEEKFGVAEVKSVRRKECSILAVSTPAVVVQMMAGVTWVIICPVGAVNKIVPLPSMSDSVYALIDVSETCIYRISPFTINAVRMLFFNNVPDWLYKVAMRKPFWRFDTQAISFWKLLLNTFATYNSSLEGIGIGI